MQKQIPAVFLGIVLIIAAVIYFLPRLTEKSSVTMLTPTVKPGEQAKFQIHWAPRDYGFLNEQTVQITDSTGQNRLLSVERFFADQGIDSDEIYQIGKTSKDPETWLTQGQKITAGLASGSGFMNTGYDEILAQYESKVRTDSARPFITEDLGCGIGLGDASGDNSEAITTVYAVTVLPKTEPGT